jgi:IPT/TIG domain
MAGIAATLAAVALGWRLSSDSGAGARRARAESSARSPAGGIESSAMPPASTKVSARASDEASRNACASTGTPSPAGAEDSARRPVEPDPDQARAASSVARAMKRFVSDLEYSPGLPEPPQQVVARLPAPWRPDPATQGQPEPVIAELSPRVAAAGAYVRLRGRNLRASAVMFGHHPAEIMSDGDEEVTVLVPQGGSGVVPVGLTNVDGSWAIAADAFTYVE